MPSIPPHDPPDWPTGRELVTLRPLDGGRHALTVLSGAAPDDLTAYLRLLPPAVYVDHASSRDWGGTAVALIFRESPVAPDPRTEPWLPAVGTDAGPDRGDTPYQSAARELLTAAPDWVGRARLIEAVTRLLPPETVMVLAEMIHTARRRPRNAPHPAPS
jgi:hypothetical protein